MQRQVPGRCKLLGSVLRDTCQVQVQVQVQVEPTNLSIVNIVEHPEHLLMGHVLRGSVLHCVVWQVVVSRARHMVWYGRYLGHEQEGVCGGVGREGGEQVVEVGGDRRQHHLATSCYMGGGKTKQKKTI